MNELKSDRKALVLKEGQFALIDKKDNGVVAVFYADTMESATVSKEYQLVAGTENGQIVFLKPDKKLIPMV